MTPNNIYLGNCLDLMLNISDCSIDMIFCDLPYGTTQCKWDIIIPFESLWKQYERIIKENGVILLNASNPFSAQLIMSNPRLFRYEWIWKKTHPKGHLNAKKMPMRAHESLLVFYKNPPTYNPQKTFGHKRKVAKTSYIKEADGNSVYGKEVRNTSYDSTERYPLSVQEFSNADMSKSLHPTQKPLLLCEYFIKTYTNEGDLVLDNCMGSGTTCLAAKNLNRQFIGIDNEPKYFDITKNRLSL